MDQQEIRALLEQVAQGQRSVDEAVLALKMEPFQELGFAKVDNHRGLRQGAAEVIYGAGKTPRQIHDIAASMRQTGEKAILITRMTREAAQVVGEDLPLSSVSYTHLICATSPTGRRRSSTLGPWAAAPAATSFWPGITLSLIHI